eukprot:12922250-Alexandrium_andersonii.AAC.1
MTGKPRLVGHSWPQGRCSACARSVRLGRAVCLVCLLEVRFCRCGSQTQAHGARQRTLLELFGQRPDAEAGGHSAAPDLPAEQAEGVRERDEEPAQGGSAVAGGEPSLRFGPSLGGFMVKCPRALIPVRLVAKP